MIHPLRQSARILLPAWAGMSLCMACSTTGTAVGRLEQPDNKAEAVTFVWKSDAAYPDRGKISGTLPDGSHYSGRYFEVIETAQADVYAPAWEGWKPYWSGWRTGWYAGPGQELDFRGFVGIYTGRVIANMKSDSDATHLRCRFQINDPRAGLVHGGRGDCQLANGQTIDDASRNSAAGP
jgi:hypothetical protein